MQRFGAGQNGARDQIGLGVIDGAGTEDTGRKIQVLEGNSGQQDGDRWFSAASTNLMEEYKGQ